MERNIQTAAFRRLLENHLSLLTPYRNKTDEFTEKVKINGYSEIPYTIASLLKLSVLALDPENCTEASAYDIMTVLETALSLLPYEEFELLDLLYKELLAHPEADEVSQATLAYNFSTIRLLAADEKLRNHQL